MNTQMSLYPQGTTKVKFGKSMAGIRRDETLPARHGIAEAVAKLLNKLAKLANYRAFASSAHI